MLEGIGEYLANGYAYRAAELEAIAQRAQEFVLPHRLFRSDRTGAIINPKLMFWRNQEFHRPNVASKPQVSTEHEFSFLMLSYPSRWFYDILRALDTFKCAGVGYDPRMQDALDVLLQTRDVFPTRVV